MLSHTAMKIFNLIKGTSRTKKLVILISTTASLIPQQYSYFRTTSKIILCTNKQYLIYSYYKTKNICLSWLSKYVSLKTFCFQTSYLYTTHVYYNKVLQNEKSIDASNYYILLGVHIYLPNSCATCETVSKFCENNY